MATRVSEKTAYVGSVTWDDLCEFENVAKQKLAFWQSESALQQHGPIIVKMMQSQLKDEIAEIEKAKVTHDPRV